MTVVYEDLIWQADKIGDCVVESVCDSSFVAGAEFNQDIKPVSLNPAIINKETHQFRDGFRLVREQTIASEPLHYLPFERSDYIGVCFVFAPENIDSKDLAFSDLYHHNLNITNGFHYQGETLNAINKPLNYVSLQFDSHFIESLNEQQPVPTWLLKLASNKDSRVLDQINIPPVLRQLAWQISQMPSTRQFSDSLRIESQALDWLAGILETNSNYAMHSLSDTNLIHTSKKFVVDACDIIHAEYCQPLTIYELAIRVGTNTSYLKKFFKQHTGFSIHEYLTHYRLKQAQNMLMQQPKLKIKTIAELCGYQAGHFSQLFKDAFGLLPSQYRELNLSSN